MIALSVELPPSLFNLRNMLDYDFIIASHCLANESYRKFYAGYSRIEDNKRPSKVLDNGAFELGASIDPRKYLELVQEIAPRIVVLPDVVNDVDATIAATKEFLDTVWEPTGMIDKAAGLMGVLQGQSPTDYLKCLDFYFENPDLEYIGVPYHLFYRPKFIRKYEIDKRCRDQGVSIHILGLPNPFEIIELREIPEVVSLDTSLPVVSAKFNRRLWHMRWKSERLDIEEVHPYPNLVRQNIGFLKSLCDEDSADNLYVTEYC